MESDKQTVAGAIRHVVEKMLCRSYAKNTFMKIKLYEILFDMALSGTTRNEREIFYMAVNTFGSQKSLNRLISGVMHETGLSKANLGIRNTLKGTFIGSIALIRTDKSNLTSSVEKLCSQSLSPQLIPDMSCVTDAFTLHPIIVVVEKDTILHRIAAVLAEEPYFSQILFVCGKGYPCRNTITLLRMLEKSSAAILGLFDFDPFGIHIYSVYKYGAKTSSNLGINSIQ
ncbi:subunit A of DNA topoisomerase VI [Ordospora colligata]|nr:subunit A of DNA topoisomerase VI [Ordospora colligata]